MHCREKKKRYFPALRLIWQKKLQEKEVVVAELKGQLEALERENSQSNTKDIITLDDQPFNKEHKMLETRISEQRKNLTSCMRKEENLRSELKHHTLNLAMIKSGINQLIRDPTTPTLMIHSLKLLRHSSMFSSTNTEDGPLEKKIKVEESLKEEYFEHPNGKQDASPEFEMEQDQPNAKEASD